LGLQLDVPAWGPQSCNASLLLPQVHAAIRENPIIEKKARSKPSDAQKWKATKLSYDERKAALKVCCASQHRAPSQPQLAQRLVHAALSWWRLSTLMRNVPLQHVGVVRSDCDNKCWQWCRGCAVQRKLEAMQEAGDDREVSEEEEDDEWCLGSV
jgi:Ribosomal L18 C-terminal region